MTMPIYLAAALDDFNHAQAELERHLRTNPANCCSSRLSGGESSPPHEGATL
jgi:hypothetical protein